MMYNSGVMHVYSASAADRSLPSGGRTPVTFATMSLTRAWMLPRRALHVSRLVASEANARPAVNPLEEPTLALVKQKWKEARLAKDSATATLLGVRIAADTRGS